MRLGLAIRLFFAALFNAGKAETLSQALSAAAALGETARDASGVDAAGTATGKAEPRAATRAKPSRSDALTLLATLQREARFVDIVQEPLADYNDAQIGAAARDVLRDCGQVLQRVFGLEPACPQPEGTEIEVPVGFDAGQYRLTGNVSGDPPFRGRLVHSGWKAERCELPQWTGSSDAVHIVSPIELEL